uniref:FYVE-type domain-containing protein n=1 Tax=Kalanchoe fedtschenkoi TaxID=63787 RepID=A0A7N1A301_KALFE
MLEKIGLPPKPSLRGNTWVVDASHCQGCAAQFTFINRKHHCRRCGGLFCNTCTQQRMVLRGQGDSPVRICDPCKQVEDAAKFERRYGGKSKVGKADSKQEDDLLRQLLGDGKDTLSSGRESLSPVSNIPRSSSSASSSTAQEESVQDEGMVLDESHSVNERDDMLAEIGSASPEKLRQQAIEEKNKYKILKANGKPGEALKAFKRGKELEREAAALELSLRKNRKKVTSSISMIKSDSKATATESQPALSTRKDKDDISAELRELGWSDKELRGADKKTGTMSLEGELSTLIGETLQNGKANKGPSVVDKSEVTAMKRKALALKREGKMAEAKEELKKAKILEKELEEQELLAEADDSDDEFASLIKSMGDDKPDDLLMTNVQVPALDIDQLMRMAEDVGEDGEITDADLDDPEIAAALKSFGWSEDASPPEKTKPPSEPMDQESLLKQIQSLKREAINHKRAGNTAEAMSLLKKAKLLERDLDAVRDGAQVFSQPSQISSSEEFDPPTIEQSRPPPKSKIMIQRELLSLKKKSLTLRREGRLDEAETELKKAKVLEQQLEEVSSTFKGKVSQVIPQFKDTDIASILDTDGKGEEEEVSENDLHDPTYLSLLSNLGWKDDDAESTGTSSKPPLLNGSSSRPVSDLSSFSENVVKKQVAPPMRRSKAELQRELLGLKRKALTLRRQGQNDEAEEVLNSAKSLEEQLAEMEVPKKQAQPEVVAPRETEALEVLPESVSVKDPQTTSTLQPTTVPEKVEVESMETTPLMTSNPIVSAPQKEKTISSAASPPLSSRDRFKLQQKCLAHKRQAMKLRREGRTEEADTEFQLAKEIESKLEDSSPQTSSANSTTNTDNAGVEDLLDPQLMSALRSIGITDNNPPPQSQAIAEPPKPLIQPSSINSSSNQERTQLEQQIKAEKIKAVTLKREGKQAEALNTLRHAKMLEKKLNSLPS